MNPQWKPTNHRIRNQTFTGWQARFPTTRPRVNGLDPGPLTQQMWKVQSRWKHTKTIKTSLDVFQSSAFHYFSMAFITKKVSRLKGSLCHGQHHRTWGLARVFGSRQWTVLKGSVLLRSIVKPSFAQSFFWIFWSTKLTRMSACELHKSFCSMFCHTPYHMPPKYSWCLHPWNLM